MLVKCWADAGSASRPSIDTTAADILVWSLQGSSRVPAGGAVLASSKFSCMFVVPCSPTRERTKAFASFDSQIR